MKISRSSRASPRGSTALTEHERYPRFVTARRLRSSFSRYVAAGSTMSASWAVGVSEEVRDRQEVDLVQGLGHQMPRILLGEQRVAAVHEQRL